jgi:hypothetical protein
MKRKTVTAITTVEYFKIYFYLLYLSFKDAA